MEKSISVLSGDSRRNSERAGRRTDVVLLLTGMFRISGQ